MLQQWRKPVLIALTPESITISSAGKTAHSVTFPHTMNDKTSWSHALLQLEKEALIVGKGKVRFILSNSYVRYAILPWQDDVFSQQDWQSLAENHLRTIYGNDVDNWKVALSMQGYGNPLVISAIDQPLLTGLNELAKQFTWSVESIEPALMATSNYYRQILKKSDGLLMAEYQHILLAEMITGYFVKIFVACPEQGQESVEVGKLAKRMAAFKNKSHIMSDTFISRDLPPVSNIADNITLKALPVKASNASMSCMLVGL